MFGFPMRTILFIDPPAFCTTIEVLGDPRLRSRPVAVSPQGADRAILLAVSAEAPGRRVCPDVIPPPPTPRRYAQAHRALHEIFARVAPVIEPRGWGHAYLDISGTERLFGPAVEV